jgi:hypothetical protein
MVTSGLERRRRNKEEEEEAVFLSVSVRSLVLLP